MQEVRTMVKEEYRNLEFEVIGFTSEDVISTSEYEMPGVNCDTYEPGQQP